MSNPSLLLRATEDLKEGQKTHGTKRINRETFSGTRNAVFNGNGALRYIRLKFSKSKLSLTLLAKWKIEAVRKARSSALEKVACLKALACHKL